MVCHLECCLKRRNFLLIVSPCHLYYFATNLTRAREWALLSFSPYTVFCLKLNVRSKSNINWKPARIKTLSVICFIRIAYFGDLQRTTSWLLLFFGPRCLRQVIRVIDTFKRMWLLTLVADIAIVGVVELLRSSFFEFTITRRCRAFGIITGFSYCSTCTYLRRSFLTLSH